LPTWHRGVSLATHFVDTWLRQYSHVFWNLSVLRLHSVQFDLVVVVTWDLLGNRRMKLNASFLNSSN
jgi:hypothetical protein